MSANDNDSPSSKKPAATEPSMPRDEDGNLLIGRALSRQNYPDRPPVRRESVGDHSDILNRLDPPPRPRQAERTLSAARPSSIFDAMMTSAQTVAATHREHVKPDPEDDEEPPRSSPRPRARAPLNPGAPLPWQPGSKDLEKGMEAPGEVRAAKRKAEHDRWQREKMAESANGRLMRTMRRELEERKQKEKKGKRGEEKK